MFTTSKYVHQTKIWNYEATDETPWYRDMLAHQSNKPSENGAKVFLIFFCVYLENPIVYFSNISALHTVIIALVKWENQKLRKQPENPHKLWPLVWTTNGLWEDNTIILI